MPVFSSQQERIGLLVRLHALMAKLQSITLKSSRIMRRLATYPIRAKF